MATVVTVTLNPAVDRTLEVSGFEPGGVYRGRLRAYRASGKGVNVSAVLSALGRPSVALGFVGLHEQSFFRASLHPALVDCRLSAVPGVTRHHTTIIDPVRRTETHLREEGFEVGETFVRELRRSIGSVLRGDDFCIFSGSLPPGIDPGRFAGLVRSCAQVGARVVVDGEGEVLAAVLAGGAARPRLELIKPNVVELGQLVGRSLRTVGQVLAAARGLCASPPARSAPRLKSVLVSWGERGAYLVTAAGAWRARAILPPERVVNSVGCGDSLLAGFVAGLNDGLPVEGCLRLGAACAAADALTYAGGDVDPNLVNQFVEQAVVERLDEKALAAARPKRAARTRARPK